MMKKIVLGMLIVFLVMGVVAAFDVDSFKTIEKCKPFEKGYSNYTIHHDRYFYASQNSYYEDLFVNDTATQYTVKSVGDNIYYFNDDAFTVYGYQEVADVDGEPYVISVEQGSKLSPSEEKELLDDLKEFNTLNNLKPIEIET